MSASVGRRLQPKEPRILRLGKDPAVTCFESGAISNRVADGMQMQCTTVYDRDPFTSLISTTLGRLSHELRAGPPATT